MMKTIMNMTTGKLAERICICAGFLLTAASLTGCGVQDRAITLDTLAEASAEETKESAEPENENQPDSQDDTVCVYVCGEVNAPGVYTLPKDSRYADALNVAGGFTDEADENYVNLAAKINDGERLYFPNKEEAAEKTASEETAKSGLVNINTADETLLCTLPGIGSARAKDIIAYREKNGVFETKEDIMKVSGIKSAAYGKICDMITVD
jgi:competence protein ComEA